MNRLKLIRKMDILIDAKQQELDRLQALMTSVKVMDYSIDRVQTSPNGDRLTDLISKIEDLKVKINKDIDDFVDFKQECMQMVDQLDDPKLIELAYKRYFQYKTFEQIADEMDLSKVWVIQLNKKLLSIVY